MSLSGFVASLTRYRRYVRSALVLVFPYMTGCSIGPPYIEGKVTAPGIDATQFTWLQIRGYAALDPEIPASTEPDYFDTLLLSKTRIPHHFVLEQHVDHGGFLFLRAWLAHDDLPAPIAGEPYGKTTSYLVSGADTPDSATGIVITIDTVTPPPT